uniref:Dimer_Tnp_hAT domain-containing protein n=1 Tax=Rhabditophanes sp. KR3021 TaxID=114890 RepID=A0AC35U9E6_9BILA
MDGDGNKVSARKVFTAKLVDEEWKCLGLIFGPGGVSKICGFKFSKLSSNTTIYTHCRQHQNLKETVERIRNKKGENYDVPRLKSEREIARIERAKGSKRKPNNYYQKQITKAITADGIDYAMFDQPVEAPSPDKSLPNIQKQVFGSAVADLIMGCGLNFSILENRAFKTFIGQISTTYTEEHIPSKKDLIDEITAKSNLLSAEMSNLRESNEFALSIKKWIKNDLQIVLIVVYWQGGSRILGIEELTKDQFDVFVDLNKHMLSLGLDPHRCISITRDPFSDIKFNSLFINAREVWCFTHVMASICKESLGANAVINNFIAKIKRFKKANISTSPKTRWYSTIEMLERNVYSCDLAGSLLGFSELDYKCMKYVIMLLAPFKEFIFKIQDHDIVHYIEMFYQLIQELKAISNFESEHFSVPLSQNEMKCEPSDLDDLESCLGDEYVLDYEDLSNEETIAVVDDHVEYELKSLKDIFLYNTDARFRQALDNELLQEACYLNPKLTRHKFLFDNDKWNEIENRLNLTPKTKTNQLCDRWIPTTQATTDYLTLYFASLSSNIENIQLFYETNGFKFPEVTALYRKYSIIPSTSIQNNDLT